jgi:hypothetical protein
VTANPKPKIPVLRGWLTQDGTQIAVFCPYCDEMHFHGWPSGTSPRARVHRVPHCGKGGSFGTAGYYVALFRKKDVHGLLIE